MAVHATPLSPPLPAKFDSAERNDIEGHVLAFQWLDASPSQISGYWVFSADFTEPHIELIDAGAVKSLSLPGLGP
jgi:hypothetical protein